MLDLKSRFPHTFPTVARLSNLAKESLSRSGADESVLDGLFVVQAKTPLTNGEAEYHQCRIIDGQAYYGANAFSFSIDDLIPASGEQNLPFGQCSIDSFG